MDHKGRLKLAFRELQEVLLDVEIILNNQLPILTSKSMVLRRDVARIKQKQL